jgi:hypothetical protein
MIIDVLAQNGISASIKANSWEDKIDLAGFIIHGLGVQDTLKDDVEIKVKWGQHRQAKKILDRARIHYY